MSSFFFCDDVCKRRLQQQMYQNASALRKGLSHHFLKTNMFIEVEDIVLQDYASSHHGTSVYNIISIIKKARQYCGQKVVYC